MVLGEAGAHGEASRKLDGRIGTGDRNHTRRARRGPRLASAIAAAFAVALVAVCGVVAGGFAAAASAATDTYSETQTIPVPPASDYAGSGGGDGWAVALSNTQVFNVFHHNGTLTVACHAQTDASTCWGPDTIKDSNGSNFQTSGQPGLYFDPSTGKLYVWATRSSDTTGGVVCVDTTQGASTPNPFCGFTALTPAGQGATNGSWSLLTAPMLVGSHWYSFNYVSGIDLSVGGVNSNGARDELLCFDVGTDQPCSGQPFPINIGAGTVGGASPSPSDAAIGTHLIVPIRINNSDELACFDDSSQGPCSGSWPVALGFAYAGNNGSPFPMLDGTGDLKGFCLPTGTAQCFGLDGSSATTPTGMGNVIGGSSPWNGPAFVLGPRVYVPNGNANQVQCYDYSTSAGCNNFPKGFNNLGYLYTVNPDPQRPTCIWVNADGGGAQIQNFDAYTGGACGQGSVRVLAAQFVVNQQQCRPSSYQSLQILTPSRSSYADGSIQFEDGDGNPIPGVGPRQIDSTGSVDLTGLNLNTATGLPQFLITLNGQSGSPGQVVVQLTWTAPYDQACIKPSYRVQQLPTRTTTALSGAGQTGGHITVPAGTAVTDQAMITGDHASVAGGTIQYTWYSDSSCSTAVSSGAPQSFSGPGQPPPSPPVTFKGPATYYAIASYSGDRSNFGSQSSCGDETVAVQAAGTPSPWTLTVALSGNGSGRVSSSDRGINCRPTCAQSYPAGTRVVLVADPRLGSAFVGWSGGGCKGTGRCTVTLNANTLVTARFDKRVGSGLRLDPHAGGVGVMPAQLNCEGELTFIRAAGVCTLARVHVAGKISKEATGAVLVRIYSWFGRREAHATISHGHWSVELNVPGINSDPKAPVYLIVVHYRGGQLVRAGTVAHRVRIEVERKGLGPG